MQQLLNGARRAGTTAVLRWPAAGAEAAPDLDWAEMQAWDRSARERLRRLALATEHDPVEQAKIRDALYHLRRSLHLAFPGEAVTCRVFGSQDRGTMLSRAFDPDGRIDYLVTFRDRRLSAASALNRLHRFAADSLQRGSIVRDNWSIAGLKNDVPLRLVPAVSDRGGRLQIPDGDQSKAVWHPVVDTDLKTILLDREAHDGPPLRALVRILKSWNIRLGRAYEGRFLERLVADDRFRCPPNLPHLLHTIAERLRPPFAANAYQIMALTRLKEASRWAVTLEREGRFAEAHDVLDPVLPGDSFAG